jgi:hypothetical protein
VAVFSAPSSRADTFNVFAAPPPDIFFPPYTVILRGTIDVGGGVISNPALQVNVYPGETFSVMQGTQFIGFNTWEFEAAGSNDQNLVLEVDFKPLPGETLSTFTGGIVYGFAVLDTTNPSAGFSLGYNIIPGITNGIPGSSITPAPGPIVRILDDCRAFRSVSVWFGVLLRKHRTFSGAVTDCAGKFCMMTSSCPELYPRQGDLGRPPDSKCLLTSACCSVSKSLLGKESRA